MHKLAEICVKRPVFAMVLILILTVFGVFGYLRLGVDRFPNVDIPVVTVTTTLSGSSPEEIETELTDKIEEAVNTISGIDELRSSSTEGMSQVYINFLLEKDPDVAVQEVRDRVNRILSDLPEDADTPVVEKLDTGSVPVMMLSLSGQMSMRDLTEFADKTIRRRLESVTGVGQVTLIGGQKRQINVRVDPLKLRAYDLTVNNIASALQTQNLQMPSGSIKMGQTEFTVRTLGRVDSVDEIGKIAVANRDGHTIIINDIGFVEDGGEEAESLSVLDETPAVMLQIQKQSGTNTVHVVDSLLERIDEIKPTIPPGFDLRIVRDQSLFIRASTDAVKEHLVLGAFFAAVVVFFFLANFRTTLIAALAIPTSIISTFAVMDACGMTMNMITLLALTLSVGIVIDDAIVVLENIFRYIEEKHYPPFEAAIAATKEIGLAVLSITLSLVAVFMPVVYMSGIVGRFMSSFGITMSAAIVVSMFVSFTLTPMLASRFLKTPKAKATETIESEGSAAAAAGEGGILKPEEETTKHEIQSSKSRGIYRLIELTYYGLLVFSLKFRFVIVLLCAGALAMMVPLLQKAPKNFLPEEDESEFEVSIKLPEGTTLEATHVFATRLARELRTLEPVYYTITSTGASSQHLPNNASIYVRMADMHDRSFSQSEFMNHVRKTVLPKYQQNGVITSVTNVAAFSGGGMANADIQFIIAGPDLDHLISYADTLMDELRRTPGAVDIDSSLIMGKPEFGLSIDRAKAAQLGVSVQDIASSLRLLIAGDKVSDYNENGEQYEVNLRAIDTRRASDTDLSLISVPSNKIGSVPLRDVISISQETGPSRIDRLNRRRQITIYANLEPGVSQQAVIDVLNKKVENMKLTPEYSSTLVGRSKELKKATTAFATVFITAIIFIYLVLAAQFESWINPIIILLALPLTAPFALLAVNLFHESLNIFSMLGILVLFAVVKKNSILQIDHTNQLRETGMPRDQAIIQANLDRLRPILMTTIAFVAGMIPLLVSKGAGSATNHTISSVIIGGQTLSLILTLLATPVAYSIFDDISRFGGWLLRFLRLKK